MSEMFSDKTDEYDMRDQPAPAPAPVDVGVVQRMYAAFVTSPSNIGIECMAVALRVAEADRDVKWERAIRGAYDAGEIDIFRNFQQSIENIRARLLAPTETAEERVVVKKSVHGSFDVWLDNARLNFCFGEKEHAEIYRLGLIATLKQEGK